MDISSPEHASAEPVRTVRLDAVAPQPWRNGGGRTRELLAWPSADGWALRISVAEIERDGPFSAFPGVQRWFAVIDGAGVALSFDGAERICRRGDAPLAFDGGDAPGCRLLDGPTRDLNLMAKHGRATLRAVGTDIGWDEPFAWRGLYAAVAGRWLDGTTSRTVEAGTLLHVDGIADDRAEHETRGSRRSAAAWRFVSSVGADGTSAAPFAWWIGYTPDPNPPR